MTGAREAQLMEAANVLMNARRTLTPIADLPVDLQPVSLDEAYVVNDLMAVAFGEIGGWKIGAPSPEATPILCSDAEGVDFAEWRRLCKVSHRYRGLEAEIAFRAGRGPSAAGEPYSRDEVIAAIASCHPAIEELESGLVDPVAAAKLSMDADLQMHGGLIYGPAYADWKELDFTKEHVTLSIDGAVRVERTGSNTSGDFLRLLPWLANEGAVRTGGLKAGIGLRREAGREICRLSLERPWMCSLLRLGRVELNSSSLRAG